MRADKSFSKLCCTCHRSKTCSDTSKIATHLTGVSIDILGIKQGDQGDSCKEHDIYGYFLSTDVVVCLLKVQCWIFIVMVDWCLMFSMSLSITIDCLMLLLLLLPLNEVIKGVHVKSMTFAALSCDWFCRSLAEGVEISFSGWAYLFFVWCCIHHWCTRHGKDHASCINGIHAKVWSFLLLSCICKSCKTEFFLLSMIIILFDVIVVVIAMDIIGTRAIMLCWLLSSQIIVTSHLILSKLVTHQNILPHSQAQV